MTDEAGRTSSARVELATFLGLGLATALLTWPLAIAGDASISAREDYFSNLWNFWWVRKALFELGTTPYWTDWLFLPDGISLLRHTLSPVNALPGALLGAVLGETAAFNAILFAHFWLAAWTFSLLARWLTGSRSGAVLGGLVYAFCPYHFYYLAQINVATTEWLPLALLFFLRSYRVGGWRNALGAGVSTLLVAASHWYYLLGLFVFCALLLALGRLFAPEVSWMVGARRACIAGAVAGVLVTPLALPLLSEREEQSSIATVVEDGRAYGNALLGAKWVEPRPHRVVSYPTMLGYSAIALVVAGGAAVLRQPFWLLVGLVFWTIALGNPIRVDVVPGGWTSPLAWLWEVPGLSVFRKPDRVFVMVQLVWALCCAFAWSGISARLRRQSARLTVGVWVGVAALVTYELSPVPLARFDPACSPWLAEVAGDESVDALIELPPFRGGHVWNAHYNLCQLSHGKKIPQGFVTSLAVTRRHELEGLAWIEAYARLLRGDPSALARRLSNAEVDLVLLNKQVPAMRPPDPQPGPVVWRPFRLVRELIGARQAGILDRVPDHPGRVRAARAALSRAYGPPVHEDDAIVAFRVVGRDGHPRAP